MTILADTRVCVHTNCQRYRVLCTCMRTHTLAQTRQREYLSPVPSLVLYSQFSISIFTLLSLARLYLTILHFYSIYPPPPSFSPPPVLHLFLPGFATLLPPLSLSLSSFLESFVPVLSPWMQTRVTMIFLSKLAGTAISTIENSSYVYLFYATKKNICARKRNATLFFLIYSLHFFLRHIWYIVYRNIFIYIFCARFAYRNN